MATKETIKLTNVLFGEKTFSAIEQNGVTGAGGVIIDVTELPTQNIDENSIYRLRSAEIDLWFRVGGESQHMMTSSAYLVSTLPETLKESTETDIHLYVIENTGVVWLNMGGNVRTYGSMIFESLGVSLDNPDKGWVTDATEMTEDGLYTILRQTLITYNACKDNIWTKFANADGMRKYKTISANGHYGDFVGEIVKDFKNTYFVSERDGFYTVFNPVQYDSTNKIYLYSTPLIVQGDNSIIIKTITVSETDGWTEQYTKTITGLTVAETS